MLAVSLPRSLVFLFSSVVLFLSQIMAGAGAPLFSRQHLLRLPTPLVCILAERAFSISDRLGVILWTYEPYRMQIFQNPKIWARMIHVDTLTTIDATTIVKMIANMFHTLPPVLSGTVWISSAIEFSIAESAHCSDRRRITTKMGDGMINPVVGALWMESQMATRETKLAWQIISVIEIRHRKSWV